MVKARLNELGTPVYFVIVLQDIVIETMLGRKNSVQGPLLLKLLFVGLKTMSPFVTAKYFLHCVLFKVSIMCTYITFQSGNLSDVKPSVSVSVSTSSSVVFFDTE